MVSFRSGGPEHELALSFPESARAPARRVPSSPLDYHAILPFLLCPLLPHELWHLNWKHLKVKQIRLKLRTRAFRSHKGQAKHLASCDNGFPGKTFSAVGMDVGRSRVRRQRKRRQSQIIKISFLANPPASSKKKPDNVPGAGDVFMLTPH